MVMMVTVAVIVSVISDRKYASAKSYSEGGTWKKTIDEMTWYISISEYSSAEGKELGNARIYKGKKAYNKNSSIASGEYVKVGTNKYKLKYKGGKIVFQVYEKKIKLKIVGLLVVLLIIVVGVSYAAFTFTKKGETRNIVSTGTLSTGFEWYDFNLLVISSKELFSKDAKRRKRTAHVCS